jgi:hypothetical protein
LLPAAALLVWAGGGGHAARADEPNNVGDRFHETNKSPGLLIDGWQVRPTLLLRGGYDGNITLRRGDGPASSEFALRGAIDADRGDGPYLLSLDGAVEQTWYPESRENDATEIEARASAVFDGRPFKLHGSLAYLQGVERAIDNGIFVDGVFEPYEKRPEYRRIPVEVGIEYKSGIELKGTLQIAAVDYETQTTTSGLSVPQNFRRGTESEVRVRGSYEVYPGLSFFGETATTWGRYRDSQGDRDAWRIAAGSSFEFSRLLLGEASAGFTQLSLPGGGETSGFTYGARMHWFASELFSLTLNAERRFDGEVVTTGLGVTSATAITHELINLRAEWEPLRQVLVYAQAGYDQEEHALAGQTDDFTAISAGLIYALTSSLRLVVDGSYEFGSSDVSEDIERHRVTIGALATY